MGQNQKALALAMALTLVSSCCAFGQTIPVERFPKNPIIHSGLSKKIGNNIQGPSLIKIPLWIKNPLGKYYLYFAHHAGKYIRLAYADDLHGPWKIHEPGVLGLTELKGKDIVLTSGDLAQIASPDVLVDKKKKEIRMYFHGESIVKGKDIKGSQITGRFASKFPCTRSNL